MSNEVLVKADNVSKRFCRSLKKSLWYGVQDIVGDMNPFARGNGANGSGLQGDTPNPELRAGEFWAVNNVSFELRRGQCLGLIGRNGAGKTTLLKMLNGLIKPDHGRIEMRGRVGALIALGAGFNPILTGRENIYVNGSVLGLTKREIEEKIEDIIDFAEIRDFIDAPVQTYSSGMSVRLGFAVATALKPDILILDEVLAVGDVRFRFKSGSRLRSIIKDTAVILVSHSMASVSLACNRGLVLQKGRTICNGTVDEAITAYNKSNEGNSQEEKTQMELLLHESVEGADIACPTEFNASEQLEIVLKIRSKIERPQCVVRVLFHTETGPAVAEFNSRYTRQFYALKQGENSISVKLPQLRLSSGSYLLDILVHDNASWDMLVRSHCDKSIHLSGSHEAFAPCVIT